MICRILIRAEMFFYIALHVQFLNVLVWMGICHVQFRSLDGTACLNIEFDYISCLF